MPGAAMTVQLEYVVNSTPIRRASGLFQKILFTKKLFLVSNQSLFHEGYEAAVPFGIHIFEGDEA